MRTEELRDMFLFEADELLGSLENLLMRCEQEGTCSEQSVAEVFRTMHTLKGSCGMMKLTALQSASHKMEDLFSFVRDNAGCLVNGSFQQLVDLVFDYVKYMREETRRTETPLENPALLERIKALETTLRGAKTDSSVSAPTPDGAVDSAADNDSGPWEVASGYQLRVRFKDTPLLTVRTKVLAKSVQKLCAVYTTVPQNPDRRPELGSFLLEKGLLMRFILLPDCKAEQVQEVLKSQPYVKNWEVVQTPNPKLAKQAKAAEQESAAGQKMISIRRDKLNRHGDLLGELVTTYNMLEGCLERLEISDDQLDRVMSQTGKLINRLHKSGLEMNMVEMDTVFFRMRLISRDMASSLGKQVKLVFEGGSTPVDKSVAEHLHDPLMHLVRNAMDHGIGTPAERIQAGKPPEGTLVLRAVPKNDEVVITVQDDGAGVNLTRVLASAKEKNLLTKPAEEYTPAEVHQLLLQPGFSTKKDVSTYSGRGVGLDVVTENLRLLGGHLRVDSVSGQGSTFIMSIPTNLAMVEMLEVEVGSTRAVMPVTSVRQIITKDMVPTKQCGWVDKADGSRMYRYDEELYPILDIDKRLHIARETPTAYHNFVFLHRREGDVVVGVDHVTEIRTVLVKGMPEYVKKIPGIDRVYSGCTISGDGRVSMVLDVNKL